MFELFIVTTLMADGQGSLAEAMNHNDPHKTRVVVFDVSGEIEWTYAAAMNSLSATPPRNIIVRGDKAPGNGITITGHPFYLHNAMSVTLKGLRFELPVAPEKSWASSWSPLRIVTDAGEHSHNVTIEHCTFYGGEDEQVSVTPMFQSDWQKNTPNTPHISDLKVTNCFFGPAYTLHRGNHNFALMVSLAEGVEITGNMMMHANRRSPQVQGTDVVIRDNIIYNYGTGAVMCMAPGNYIVENNLFKPGYNSRVTNPVAPISVQTTGTGGKVVIDHGGNVRLKYGGIPFDVDIPVDNQTGNTLDTLHTGSQYDSGPWHAVKDAAGSRRLPLDAVFIQHYLNGTGGWCRTRWAHGGFDAKGDETGNVLKDHGLLD